MKKVYFRIAWILVFTLVVNTMFTACRSTVNVDGKSFAMLRDSEVEELVSSARIYLQGNASKPQIVTESELRQALNTQPEVHIEYSGNCRGNASVSWQFPNRKTMVLYRGELNNEHNRLVAVSIQEKQPEIIDASGQLPRNSKILKNNFSR